MLIIGAGGMAKELVQVLSYEMNLDDDALVFYDDINMYYKLFDRFEIINNFDRAKSYLKEIDNKFVIGIGNPSLREQMYKKFSEIDGELTSVIASNATLGSFNTEIGSGCLIMHGAIITNGTTLGKGVLINLNSTISHDCTIGDFTEIACNVSIPGKCNIGKNVFIGNNATLMPNITIGDHSIIGAGTMVLSDVPANTTVVGNPHRKI